MQIIFDAQTINSSYLRVTFEILFPIWHQRPSLLKIVAALILGIFLIYQLVRQCLFLTVRLWWVVSRALSLNDEGSRVRSSICGQAFSSRSST